MKPLLILIGCLVAAYILWDIFKYFRRSTGEQVKLSFIADRYGNQKAEKMIGNTIKFIVFNGDTYTDRKDHFYCELYFRIPESKQPERWHYVTAFTVPVHNLGVIIKSMRN